MNEYYPIFVLAFLYVVFASIQDIRKREVSNWVNFSLLTFILAYRLFYGIINDNYYFFIYSIVGVLVFMLLANLFYYGRVFAGGDAKLLIAFGAIIPFDSWYSIIYLGLSFIFLLFLVGAVYSLIYSSVLALHNFFKFKKEFRQNLRKYKFYFLISIILALFLILEYSISGWNGYLSYYSIVFLLLIPFIFVFLKSVENNSMIKLVSYGVLTEGDWLYKDVKMGNRVIKRSVHGLSLKDIELIRKNRVNVWVKYGLPFVPSFLMAFIIMVFFFLFSKFDLQSFLLSLF